MKVRTSTKYELEKSIVMGDISGFKAELIERLTYHINRMKADDLAAIFEKAAELSDVDWDAHYEEVYDDGVAVSQNTLRVQAQVVEALARDIMDFIRKRGRAESCELYKPDH